MFRRYSFAAALSLAAAFVLPGVNAYAEHARSLSSPKTAALALGDVPHGFTIASASFVTNAQMAQKTKIARKQFDAHGRINGYEQSFQGTNVRTYISVVDNLYLYRTAAGAHWDYTQSLKSDLKQHMQATTAPRIGDESTGLVLNTTASRRQVTIYAISFRKGAVDVEVGVSGLTGHVTMAQAAHYARVVAGRIH